jgi:hypothetical protein
LRQTRRQTIGPRWIALRPKLDVEMSMPTFLTSPPRSEAASLKPEAAVTSILECTDVALLERWVTRAVTAATADDVFSER